MVRVAYTGRTGSLREALLIMVVPLLFLSLAFAVTVTQPSGVTGHSGNNYSLELLGTITDSTVRSLQTTNWTCLVTQCNFSLVLDADTFNFSGFLGFSDFSVSSVLYKFGNAWRNASELRAIGQGDFTVNGSHVSLGLAGSDGFDFGVRDNQEGGSYWYDESGNLYGKINISNDFLSVSIGENETTVYNSSGGRIFNYTFNDAFRVENQNLISLYGTGTQNKTVYFFDWSEQAWKIWMKNATGNATHGVPDWNDPRNKQSFKWMYAFQKTGMNLTGLKTYYRFDEPNGNLINFAGTIGSSDSLGTTADGINTNMNVSSPGRLGNSYYYSENASDGTQIGYSKSQFNFMHNNNSMFTFAFWYKAPVSHDFATGKWIFSTSNQDVNCIGVGFNIYWQNNGLNLVIENGTAGSGTCTPVSATASSYLPDTNWHLYTVSYDINLLSNNVRMTRDGGNAQTFSRTGYGNNTDATYFPTLGRRNASAASAFLEGQLDEISIWNRVLTDSEILGIYNNGTGMGMGDLDKPKINITYSMTAHDPFVRTFVDTLSPQWFQNNISIPISLGESKSSVSYNVNKAGSYFITSGGALEQALFATQNFKNGTHNFNYTVPSNTQLRYDYTFNSTMNQNFLFSLGTGGTINTTGFNPTTNATAFSSETMESVANSTLTWYDIGGLPDFTDNFSSDRWTDFGYQYQVNISTGKLDFLTDQRIVSNTTVFDLGAGAVSNTSWVLRAKVNYTTITQGTSGTSYYFFLLGISDQNQNTAFDNSGIGQDFLGLQDRIAPTSGGNEKVHDVVGYDSSGGLDNPGSPVFSRALQVETLYIEMKRTSATNFSISFFSDPDYRNLLESQTKYIASTVSGLRYIKLGNGVVGSTNTNTQIIRGTIDDLKFWNGMTIAGPDYEVSNPVGSIVQHKISPLFFYDGGASGIWKFDEGAGTNVTDASSNDVTGRLNGSVTWISNSSCRYGGCLKFSSTGYNRIVFSNPVITGQDFALSVWIKGHQTGSATYIQGNYGTGNTNGVQLGLSSGNAPVICVTNGYCLTSPTTITDMTKWYYIVATRSSGAVKIYIDGIMVKEGTSNLSIAGSLNWSIGNGPDFATEPVNGILDDVRAYPRALGESEIRSHYQRSVSKYYDDFSTAVSGNRYRYFGVEDSNTTLQPITPAGTVLHLRFNDNSTVNVSDISGNGVVGRNVNNALWLTNSSCKNSFDGCMLLSEGNDYVNLGDNLDMGNSSFTVSVWFNKKNSSTEQMKIINKGRAGAGTPPEAGYNLITTSGVIEFDIADANEVNRYRVNTTEPSINEWHHAAGILDRGSSKIRLYVDGIHINTTSIGSLGSLDTNLNLAIGALTRNDIGATDTFFDGAVDEVIIVNRSLSSDEIYQLYIGGANRSVNGRWHRVASADDLQSIAFNLTDHDLSSQRDYDQRELLFIGIQSIDAPRWFNITNTSSGQTYPGTHQFNVTWIANGTINASLMEHNFTGSFANYSVQNQSSVYYYFTDMPAGTFAYRFLANDSLGQWNATPQTTYIVNKATPTLSIFLNGTQSNRTYGYPDTVNASAFEGNSGDADVTYTLYRNATNVTSGSLSRIEQLPNATHNFTFNASGGQNYSTLLVFATAQVNKGVLALSLSGANATYPTAVSVTPGEGNSGDADVNYTVWRNASTFSTSNGSAPSSDTAQLAAYAYIYVLNATPGQNWTANATGLNLTIVISKGGTNATLFLNGTRANYTIELGNIANITAAINVTRNISLYTSFGGFLGNASQSFANYTNASNLALGAYQITANFSGDENYTASSEQWYLNVTNFAPIILSVSSGSVGSASATITWSTNEASNSTVYYGTTQAASSNTSNSSLVTSHSVPLSSLTASTLYYFNVSSCDVFGACNSSSQYNFTTSAAATTTTTTAGSSGGGGGGGSAATTTTASTTTTITQTTTTTLQGVTTTTIREATQDNVQEDLKKVENAILRADALKVNIDRAKELLAQAYRAYEKGDFILAQAIAEQAFNEALAKVEEKNKEPSVSIFLMVGVVAGLVGIIVVYLKRDSVSPAIETAKVAFSGLSGRISESASLIRASLKKKSPPLKGEGPFGANIAEILEDPERYAGKGVIIANCKLIEITKGEYVLEDVTGTVPGYSDQIGLQGTGTVEGKVIYSEGRLYIEF